MGVAVGSARGGFKGRMVVALVVIALIATGAAPALGVRATYKTQLSASAEVPPTVSSGRATAKFKTDSSSVNINWGFIWSRLTSDAVAGHIHCGAAGTNGPVGVTLFSGSMGTRASIAGTFNAPDAGNECGWVTTADVVAAMASGNTYVNLHTVNYPDGELRGQLALG